MISWSWELGLMGLAVTMALGLAVALAIRLLDIVAELRRSCSRELF
jgi:hypothetical protein